MERQFDSAIPDSTERGPAWSGRFLGKEENAGSNPAALTYRTVAKLGIASAWGAEDRWFKSSQSDSLINMQINDPWGDSPTRWQDQAYLQWLKEIWHVEIKEEPRHLWPGQWTISGHWEDEKALYKKYEKEWEKRRQEVWDKKHPAIAGADDAAILQTMANGDIFSTEGEDYFHWNVQTPGWSMHQNGSWQKMLVNMDDWKGKTRDQYPGIYNSYEHACKTLSNYSDLLAPRFALGELTDYEKHLKDFVDNYKYER